MNPVLGYTIFEVMEQISDDIRKLSQYFGCPPYLTDDVIQDVHLKLLEIKQADGNLDRLMFDGKLNRAYLFKMVRSITIQMMRSEGKYQTLTDRPVFPDDGLGLRIRRKFESVMDCHLLGANAHYKRDLFYLTFDGGMSARKISRQSGIPLKNIYLNLTKVKKVLRQQLKNEYDEFKT